jgi:hypothetical protein
MADTTSLSLSVHTQSDTEFKLYALDGTGREVLRIGSDTAVFLYPADLIRLRDAIDAFLAPADQAEAA